MTVKTHISSKNKSHARGNIERKVRLLEQWLENGLPASGNEAELCPISLRQFNAWTKKDDRDGGFAANAASTLRQHPEVTQHVLMLMKLIQQKEAIRTKRRNISEATEMRQEIVLERSKRKVLEREYLKSRIELGKVEKSIQELKVKMRNLESEAKSQIEAKEQEVALLKIENKELLKKFSKLTTLVRKR